MAATVLPRPQEWERLAIVPGSVTWQRAADVRLGLAAGYALLLQVAHPTVAAGVSDHSQFRSDPWGRLLRTLDYTYTIVYGGPAAAAETGRRIRRMHRAIRGTMPDGSAYSALEPEPYAWVHATLAEAIVRGHERFGSGLDERQCEHLWREWRALGRMLGIRPCDLPADWQSFRAYFATMIARRLQHTGAVDEVLDALARPAPPELKLLRGPGWLVLRPPLARVVRLATVGLLPEELRRRLQLTLSRAEQLELAALSLTLRTATPLMPGALRNTGPGYMRWRAQASPANSRSARRPSEASGSPWASSSSSKSSSHSRR
jgi:uncharacterized protein (DUF2236 family)